MSAVIFTKLRTDAFTDMPLQETLHWVEKISCHLADEINILKGFDKQHAGEIADLLSEETINRFKGVAMSLRFPYENFQNHEGTDKQHLIEQGLIVQSWSSLGSLLESTLQIFLAFYYKDYVKSEWYKWDADAIQQITDELEDGFKVNLTKLAKENESSENPGVTTEILKSFMKKVKSLLKDKKNDPRIDKITLYDLIEFYFSQEIFNENEHSKDDFQKIRDYRNAIHAFQERVIGDWVEFNKYIKNLILLSIDMLHRLPPIPDEEPMHNWFVRDRNAILMKEREWFQYRMESN